MAKTSLHTHMAVVCLPGVRLSCMLSDITSGHHRVIN